MKKVFKIFKRDLKDIIKTPTILIIIAGLCILPSLYAWINIKACWDPYSNTGNLPVAIVNNDKGTVINGKIVNVGNQIVDQLKKNKSIGWKFVDDWQGNYGLNNGNYYALIEIPSNFSTDLSSLTTKTPIKPNLIYKVNEKTNAIATKITDAAEAELTKQITGNFVDTVTVTAFSFLNKIGNQIEINKPKILQFKEALISSNDSLTKIKDFINNASDNSKSLDQYLTNVKDTLPNAIQGINNIQGVTEASKSLINSTNNNLNSSFSNLNLNISDLTVVNKQIQLSIDNLKNLSGDINNLQSNGKSIIDKISTNLNDFDKTLNSMLGILESINVNGHLQNTVQIFKNLQTQIENQKSQLKTLSGLISTGNTEEVKKYIDIFSNTSNDISNKLNNLSNNFYYSNKPILNDITNNLNNGLDNANNILNNTKLLVPQLSALADFGIASNKVSSEQAKNLTDKLTNFQDVLDKLNEKFKIANDENLNKVIDMMQKNPQEIGNFISSPINVKKVDVYDAGIFGVGLTPFYTVLAIWVGALLAAALLSTHCEDFNDGTKLNLFQKHFGKMSTFLFISLIQSVIISLGDVFILGVKPANFSLFMCCSFMCSITFTIMIFTLVSLFGNIGKAIAVVIMVFQIAGAGGIYPIQTNPEIYKILNPIWPFTYAIDAFREAIAGPIMDDLIKDFKFLFIVCIIFLALVLIKKHIWKVTEYMEEKFKESGLSQ